MKRKKTHDRHHPVHLIDPEVLTIFQMIKNSALNMKDKTAMILFSSVLLLILWGAEGDFKVFLSLFGENWPRTLLPGLSWRNQLISFLIGFVLLVVIPASMIKWRFKEKLSEYGLGWPKEQRKLGVWAFFIILAIAVVPFYIGSLNPELQKEYPLFGDAIAKGDWGNFIPYELSYLLFFITIEFIFRGFLLFGLCKAKGTELFKGVRIKGYHTFGLYAILIQMLSYTMWHINKPSQELLGTVFWGIGAGAVALRIRSIWPIILAHWILNVFLDILIWIR